jgi:hypothetical protein
MRHARRRGTGAQYHINGGRNHRAQQNRTAGNTQKGFVLLSKFLARKQVSLSDRAASAMSVGFHSASLFYRSSQ